LNPPPHNQDNSNSLNPLNPTDPLANIPSLAELGAYLRSEREKQGITRNEISSRTKITIDQLTNLETGTFTGLAPVYAKGFLKSYAQAINIDHTSIILAYKKLTGQNDLDPRKPLLSKYREIDLSEDSGVSMTSSFVVFFVIVVLLVLLVIFNPSFHNFAANYLPFLDPIEASSEPSTSTPPPASETEKTPPSPQSLVPLGAPAAIPLRPLETIPSPSEVQPIDTAAPENPEPTAQSSGGTLKLTAVKATWAQIQVDNSTLIHVYFKEGETRSFSGEKSISLTCGDGKAIQGEWNGEDLGLLGSGGPMELTLPPPQG
jgi:cytoskeleton protein RodZ